VSLVLKRNNILYEFHSGENILPVKTVTVAAKQTESSVLPPDNSTINENTNANQTADVHVVSTPVKLATTPRLANLVVNKMPSKQNVNPPNPPNMNRVTGRCAVCKVIFESKEDVAFRKGKKEKHRGSVVIVPDASTRHMQRALG